MIGTDAVRGHIDLIVLSILSKEPSYAYEISQLIQERSAGKYSIKQTTLYTAVKRLEAQGALISEQHTSDSGKARTYYFITLQGKELLTHKQEEWGNTRALVNSFIEDQEA